MEELCGFGVPSGRVSNLNKQLDVEFEKWRTRPQPPVTYITLDATYYKFRIDGVVRDCATLIAYVTRRDDGKRIILGVSCALSEAEVHWRNFLNSLKAALKAALNGTPWQRCQFHIQQNAREYVTKQHLKDFVKIYPESQPKLAAWAEEKLLEGFALPEAHRKRLRTSNACENVNGQIKKRTRVVGLFLSEESLLRLVTSVLIEISGT